jgi:outer membrane protein
MNKYTNLRRNGMNAPKALTIRLSRFSLTLALGAIVLSAVAWRAGANGASGRPPATATAVAVVNLPSVLQNLTEREVRQHDLDASAKIRQAQLDELTDRIKVIEADLDPENGTVKQGTRQYRDKVIELRELQVTLEARYKLLNQVLSFDRGSVLRGLYTKIEAAVAQIAERDGYDIVLLDDTGFAIPEEAGQDDMNRAILSRTMLYTHESVDISDQVIRLLNNEFQAGSNP